jgi:hypothetical protein
MVLLSDRSAAFRGDACGSRTQRTAAEAYEYMMKTGRLARGWWEPVRKAVLRFAGGEEQGTQPVTTQGNNPETISPLPLPDRVVITYISRQGVRRRLIHDDHVSLVLALRQLVLRKNRVRGTGPEWEFNVVQAENLTKDEQVRIAARTTVSLQRPSWRISFLLPPRSCWAFMVMA